jgi:hypothetical protein
MTSSILFPTSPDVRKNKKLTIERKDAAVAEGLITERHVFGGRRGQN